MKRIFLIVMIFSVSMSYGMNQTDKDRGEDSNVGSEVRGSIKQPRDKKFFCDLGMCDIFPDNQGFEDEIAFAEHHREVHGVRVDIELLKKRKMMALLFCKICSKEIRGESELKHHLDVMHKFCVLCDKEIPMNVTRLAHGALMHPEEIKPIVEE